MTIGGYYMHRNINASNWAKRLKFCRQTTLKELGRLVNEYVSSDYLACLKSTHFNGLNVFEVIAFLRLPARCSCPEHENLPNWVRKNLQERASYTAIVLKELNLAALPEQLLHHYFTTEPLLNRYDTNRLYKMALKEGEDRVLGQSFRRIQALCHPPRSTGNASDSSTSSSIPLF